MASYRGSVDGPERAKAIAAVGGVHAVLAAIIIAGLNVPFVHRAVDQFKTFTFEQPPPPPPPVPPPQPRRDAAKKPQGAPAKKAEPSPVVAPPPKIPAPSPVVAARTAGTGNSATSGAATAGSGTGAGGSGNGSGGGGYTDYSRFTPARLVSNIPSREYGRLAATGIPSGIVGVKVLVDTHGSIASCRIARSSGDASVDALVCQLTRDYVRFTPARDPDGRPVAQEITYFPNWRRR